jgi:hypothetical protein
MTDYRDATQAKDFEAALYALLDGIVPEPERRAVKDFILRLGDSWPMPESVLFNGPVTVVFWRDGRKTVVKCRECDDGPCVYDRDWEGLLPMEKLARATRCKVRFDTDKAVMAAMLKRLLPGYQDVLRAAREATGDE